ncbi:hypothetical protein ACWATR_00720 [Nostoc sp. UIC 10890]
MPWRTIFGLFLTPGFAYVFIFIRSHSPSDNNFYNTIRTDLFTRRTSGLISDIVFVFKIPGGRKFV